LVRNGEAARAAESFRAALHLCTNDAERAHLTRRLESIGQNTI
jgi:predicted RNA polymerase sigma factor